MNGNIGEVDAAYLQTLHQLTTEMQSGRRCRHSPLVLGIDGLEILHVIGCHRTLIGNIARHWGRTQGKEFTLKLLAGTVIKETQRASTTGGIVDYFSHHRSVLVEEELVADTNLTGWLDQDIP